MKGGDGRGSPHPPYGVYYGPCGSTRRGALPDDCVSVVHAFARPVHAAARCWAAVRFLRCAQCAAPVARMADGGVADWVFVAVDDHFVYRCPYVGCVLGGTAACRACLCTAAQCGCARHEPGYGVGYWTPAPPRRLA